MDYFDYDDCGKRSVRRPGDMCGECQERYYMDYQESEAQWFSESALCQQCGNACGFDVGDLCDHYKMPLFMVKRKHNCKWFVQYEDFDNIDYYDGLY